MEINGHDLFGTVPEQVMRVIEAHNAVHEGIATIAKDEAGQREEQEANAQLTAQLNQSDT